MRYAMALGAAADVMSGGPAAGWRAAQPLWPVLALFLPLAAWGLDYGLPNVYTWAQDEIIPAEVLEGVEQRFAGGWHSRYPPLHYGLMAAAYAPVLLLSPPVAVTHDSPAYERLFLAGRLLSLALAAGTLVLVYSCGASLFGAAGGAFAAACLGLSPTFVYYAKFANLDVPYLFWFALALRLALRLRQTAASKDAILAAVAAALSAATKDQACALFVLPALAGLVGVRRLRRGERAPGGFLGALRDRRLWLPLALAALVFAVAHNLPWNVEGFSRHVRLIAGDASRDYRMFEPGLDGQLALLRQSARLVRFVLGDPAALVALLGLWLAWRSGERSLLSTLLPIASLQLFFLAVVGYAYDRFVLPHALVLSLFAGRAFQAISAGTTPQPRSANSPRMPGGPVWRGLCAAAVLALGVLRVVSLDLLLARDARYGVEAWFREHVRPDARVALLGPLEYLPRPGGPHFKQRTELVRAVLAMAPDYVVVNQDFAARAEDERARALYEGLASGQLGYALARGGRTPIPWPFRLDEYVRLRTAALPSNLDKINPEIRVYAKPR